ncbi:MAG TPA: ribonuclease Z [Ruminococcaceae bacterium]|nr:ribonuclease Z [Oscillospiraceae bacterium]
MKMFICTDKNGGTAFADRRQSSDSAVRKKIFEITGGKPLYLNSYSAQQFEDKSGLIISEDFISNMHKGDFCFAENTCPDLSLFDELYIFNWNRNYPADKYFEPAPAFKRVKSEKFTGTSHDKITLTVYRREAK